jgi:hypothetical protein
LSHGCQSLIRKWDLLGRRKMRKSTLVIQALLEHCIVSIFDKN